MKQPQGGSRVIHMAEGYNCNDFKEPSSLKDLLDLFAKLDATNGQCNEVKEKVLEELKSRLTGKDDNGWIRNGAEGIEEFYDGNGCGFMSGVTEDLSRLRDNILKDTVSNDLGQDAQCIKMYADAIINNAFPLFGCLYYLWFMCSLHCNTIRNGTFPDWENEHLDGQKNGLCKDHCHKNLHKFLKNQRPECGDIRRRILPRGFNGIEGKFDPNTQGKGVFRGAETLLDVRCGNAITAYLQDALFFLLFLAPRWCHAMSGHALLFLQWFNKKAKTDFPHVQWLHVTKAETYFQKCEQLETQIKGLVSLGNISPVYNGAAGDCQTDNLYSESKSILNTNANGDKRSHVFMQYVSWLWWCIPQLIQSLELMKNDSTNWSDCDEFKHARSFGPFAFGFTFTDKWTNGKNATAEQLDLLMAKIKHYHKDHIGAFFWAIRKPFAIGFLGAWIVAFTILLYVYLIPLDVLRLKSHLLASPLFQHESFLVIA